MSTSNEGVYKTFEKIDIEDDVEFVKRRERKLKQKNTVLGILLFFVGILLLTTLILIIKTALREDQSIPISAPPDKLLVRTECGPIRGIQTDSIRHFYGIRYALPPVQDLRWAPPVPLKQGGCWSGILNASQDGEWCMQYDNSENIIGSEDCLSLNVHVPIDNRTTPVGESRTKLPVVVVFHGGNSVSGGAEQFNFTQIAIQKNVVVVTVNFRLGVFGFLALSELSATSHTQSSGNYGIRDAILALEWVRDNIDAFGGDKNYVTIFGHSSGGTMVNALLVSPLAKGLFHAAISLSPSPRLNDLSPQVEEANRIGFLNQTSCAHMEGPKKVVSCLRKLSSKELMLASPLTTFPYWSNWVASLSFPTPTEITGGLIIVDGKVIPAPILEAFAKGKVHDVPYVVGTMAQEVDIFQPISHADLSKSQFITQLTSEISPFPNGNSILPNITRLYDDDDSDLVYTTMLSDIRFTCGVLQLIKAAAQNPNWKSPKFHYINTQKPNVGFAFLSTLGIPFVQRFAFHVFDIASLTGINSFAPDYVKKEQDEQYQNMLANIFSSVATGSLSTLWPPYTLSTPVSGNIHVPHIENVTSLKEKECNYWESIGFINSFSDKN